MLTWGSLEDQVDKRDLANVVGTPTKKKEILFSEKEKSTEAVM